MDVKMKTGLIGYNLKHSYSDVIHSLLRNDDYKIIDIKKDELEDFFKKRDFTGVNVTIPYKQEVIKYLDHIDETSKRLNAVNTIVNKDGKLFGYNTDYYGFFQTITEKYPTLVEKNCAILGSGGASHAVKAVLEDLKAKTIYVVSRKNSSDTITYEQLKSKKIDIIINTTPCGMFPSIDDRVIDINDYSNIETLYDLIYNPRRTRLMIDASIKNIDVYGGIKMLINQAIKSSELFYNSKVSEDKYDLIKSHLETVKTNIVLIGMSGCGKSTYGKSLAKKYNLEFIDTDILIEEKLNMHIKDIFNKYGEEYFRTIEKEIIKEVSILQGKVIATGGGTILDEDNVNRLKGNGILYFIDKDASTIYENIKDDILDGSRPKIKGINDIEILLKERLNKYIESADYIIK